MRRSGRTQATAFILVFFAAGQASADIDVFSDGSDGDLTAANNIEIDLGGAPTLAWDTPSPRQGSGVYDPEKWAVVFKYSSVNIASTATVTFKNHPSGAPVVWLVQGTVTINGIVSVDGNNGSNGGTPPTHAEGGPGGFRGGRGSSFGSPGSAGFGPGAAAYGDGCNYGSGGSYGTLGGQGSDGGGAPGPTYGNPVILPLIGGSGGTGFNCPGGNALAPSGGAGGGAILIASNTTIAVAGTVRARGGNGGAEVIGWRAGGGSGGGIRLIAHAILGNGTLVATGGAATIFAGNGGHGRIRVETNSNTLTDQGSPPYTQGFPTNPVNIWPDVASPVIQAVSIAEAPISLDPKRGLNFPEQEVFLATSDPGALLVIEAFNVPAASQMKVRVVPKSGVDLLLTATKDSGDVGFSTWFSQPFQVPGEISSVQVRVVLP